MRSAFTQPYIPIDDYYPRFRPLCQDREQARQFSTVELSAAIIGDFVENCDSLAF